jgi:ribosome-associated protein
MLNLNTREFRITFVRSAGPGGQNVNKLNTRALVRICVRDSRSLTAEQRDRITRRLAGRLSRSGEVQVSCQRNRTQAANRREAVQRLVELLEQAAIPPRVRRKTHTPVSTKRRRIEDKKRRAALKQSRRSPRTTRDD